MCAGEVNDLNIRKVILFGILIALSSCGGGSSNSSKPPVQNPQPTPPEPVTAAAFNYVGFFNPDATPAELVSKMSFGVIDAETPAQVEGSLTAAAGTKYKVRIDFSLLLLKPKTPSELSKTYTDPSGAVGRKVFSPLANVKLSDVATDAEIARVMSGYIGILARHKDNVGVIFLADEPYLNGITKSELERGIRALRSILDSNGLPNVKLGVTFASGMFDPAFAKFIDQQSGRYVQNIDNYYQHGQDVISGKAVDYLFDIQAYNDWLNSIRVNRLTTYDAAGNMFTDGGIPAGVDVVGFDFYLSTILEDGIHENTLSWLAANYPDAGCNQFAGVTMTQFRSLLSFFHDGPILEGQSYQDADRASLDALYQCRMEATLQMLQKAAAANKNVRFQLTSESSSNGVLEFDSHIAPEQGQPMLLIEARVLDEVVRAETFYSSHREQFQCGLTFFVYQDAFDHSINLKINGASSLPSVTKSVIDYSATPGTRTALACD
jgi:hypothetical protein